MLLFKTPKADWGNKGYSASHFIDEDIDFPDIFTVKKTEGGPKLLLHIPEPTPVATIQTASSLQDNRVMKINISIGCIWGQETLGYGEQACPNPGHLILRSAVGSVSHPTPGRYVLVLIALCPNLYPHTAPQHPGPGQRCTLTLKVPTHFPKGLNSFCPHH